MHVCKVASIMSAFSPPGSPVRGILQARILEWVAMPSSRGSSWPRGWTHVSYVSCIGRWVLYHSCYLRSHYIFICMCVNIYTVGKESALSINKDVTAISFFGPPAVNEGYRKGKESLWSSRCAYPPPRWLLSRSGCEESKNQVAAPGCGDHMKGMTLITPDACIFPYMKWKCLSLSRVWLFETPWTGRVLNSFTWDIWFSLINSNLWCSDCLPSFVISYISLFPLPPPQSSISGLPEMLYLRLEVLKISHQIK